MDVVGHDLEGVEIEIRVMRWEAMPTCFDDSAGLVEAHLIAVDIAENASSAINTYRNEIGACARVVISGQPNRLTMMFLGIVHSRGGSQTRPPVFSEVARDKEGGSET